MWKVSFEDKCKYDCEVFVSTEETDNKLNGYIYEIETFDNNWINKYKDDNNICPRCKQPIYLTDRTNFEDPTMHLNCWLESRSEE